MPAEKFDAKGFIRSLQAKGWNWSGTDENLLLHPADHDFFLRYDAATDRLMLSPRLNEHLELVIPTPPGKSKVFVR